MCFALIHKVRFDKKGCLFSCVYAQRLSTSKLARKVVLEDLFKSTYRCMGASFGKKNVFNTKKTQHNPDVFFVALIFRLVWLGIFRQR